MPSYPLPNIVSSMKRRLQRPYGTRTEANERLVASLMRGHLVAGASRQIVSKSQFSSCFPTILFERSVGVSVNYLETLLLEVWQHTCSEGASQQGNS